MINVLVAIAAGCASALMFASISSGALVSLALFYLAPLPLMVAAIGFSATGAAIGGVTAGLILGGIFGVGYLAAFFMTIALPAWWLGHLALLGRGAQTTAIEWYPVGRILVWIAGFAVVTTMAALFTLGSDSAAIGTALRGGLMRVAGERSASPELDMLGDAMVAAAPAAAAIVATLTLTLNLWLAAKIAAISGRLKRPWPDLPSTTLPSSTLAALALALALAFAGGLVAMAAQATVSALMIAYGFCGLATLHVLTLTLRHRGFWLGSAYAMIFVFAWPMLAFVVLGLADAVLGLRRRYLHPRPPAAAPPV